MSDSDYRTVVGQLQKPFRRSGLTRAPNCRNSVSLGRRGPRPMSDLPRILMARRGVTGIGMRGRPEESRPCAERIPIKRPADGCRPGLLTEAAAADGPSSAESAVVPIPSCTEKFLMQIDASA